MGLLYTSWRTEGEKLTHIHQLSKHIISQKLERGARAENMCPCVQLTSVSKFELQEEFPPVSTNRNIVVEEGGERTPRNGENERWRGERPSFNVAEVEVRTVQRKTRSKVSSLPVLFSSEHLRKIALFPLSGRGRGRGERGNTRRSPCVGAWRSAAL